MVNITNEDYQVIRASRDAPPSYTHTIAYTTCDTRGVPITLELIALLDNLVLTKTEFCKDTLCELINRYEARMLNKEPPREAYLEICPGRSLGTIQLIAYSPEGIKGKTTELLLATWVELGEKHAFPKDVK
jgi:hypothetical protein